MALVTPLLCSGHSSKQRLHQPLKVEFPYSSSNGIRVNSIKQSESNVCQTSATSDLVKLAEVISNAAVVVCTKIPYFSKGAIHAVVRCAKHPWK